MRMEVLAPAGSPEHVLAAAEGGADAVYLGGKLFSARRYAGNFSNEELKETVRFCHIKGMAVYVTINILISDQERAAFRDYLMFLGSLPVDGLIVQDLGAAAEAHRLIPHIPLHASTQMTVTSLEGVEFLKSLHFTRVVLARELSLKEIQHIASHTDMEIEVFVHGALCVCYSGQCLMSSFIGGRSGNRGACAQPCRLPYELTDSAGRPFHHRKGRYILSMKDMTGLDRIWELSESGAMSLKIEGRMKSTEYVYQTVHAYRKALDAFTAGENVSAEDLQIQLEKGFSRGYTHDYYDNHPGPSMMTGYAPGNHGIPAGHTVLARRGEFRFSASFLPEWTQVTGLSYVTASDTIAFVEKDSVFPVRSSLFRVRAEEMPKENGSVYWHLKEEKRSFSLSRLECKIPVSIVVAAAPGKKITLTMADQEGNKVTIVSDYMAEKAVKCVTEEDDVRPQAERLGNTLLVSTSFSLQNEGCMIPRSVVNQLRQAATIALEEKRIFQFEERQKKILLNKKNEIPSFSIRKVERSKKPMLAVRTDKVEQAVAAAEAGAEWIIFGGESFSHRVIPLDEYTYVLDECRKRGVGVSFSTPRLVRDCDTAACKNRFLHLADMSPDAMEVQFLGALMWTKELQKPAVIEGGPALNIFSTESLHVLEELGLSGAFLSPELTLAQIRPLCGKSSIPIGVYVYGRAEMMVSEYCVIQAVMTNEEKQRCPAPCRKASYMLTDEAGRKFPVKTDEWCRMHILNCRVLDMRPYLIKLREAGVSRFALDLRRTEEAPGPLCRSYLDILSGQKQPPIPAGDDGCATRGHFFRGVL